MRPLNLIGYKRLLWRVPLYVFGAYGTLVLARATFLRVRWLDSSAGPAAAVARAFPDAYQLYDHHLLIEAGSPLYRPWPDFRPDTAGPYPAGRVPYPPFLTPALSPFMHWGFQPFAEVWLLLLIAAAGVYALCLGSIANGRGSAAATLDWLMLLFAFPPVRIALLGGNVEPILWAALGLALVFPRARGVALAAIGLIKLWGIWPLAVACRRGGSRVMVAAALTGLCATTLSALVLGPARFGQGLIDWLRYTVPVVSQGFASLYNVSLGYAGLRLASVGGWGYAGGPLPVPARIWLATVGVATPVAIAWFTRKRSPQFQLAAVAAAAVLSSPVCWLYYLPTLLAVVAVSIRERAPGATATGIPAAPASALTCGE